MEIETHQLIPLSKHEGGTVRVSGTRVSLDSIVYAYKEGAAAEEIVNRFPSVTLADTYVVIGYYLAHQEAIDHYLQQREAEAAALQQEVEAVQSPVGRRERLMERIQDRRAPQ